MRKRELVNEKEVLYAFFCSKCDQYLPISEFYNDSIKRGHTRCKKCKLADQNKSQKPRTRTYEQNLVRYIRAKEKEAEDQNTEKIVKYISIKDVKYLLNVYNYTTIRGQQMKTEQEKRKCVLVRWDNSLPFYPWNMVYVTKIEAKKHKNIISLPHNYCKQDIMFIERMLSQIQLNYQKVNSNKQTNLKRKSFHSEPVHKKVKQNKPK